MLFGLPGSLGTQVRSLLLFGKRDSKRSIKEPELRAAWWMYQQHLAGGKFVRQTHLSWAGTPMHNSHFEPSYPQFPSKAALLKHFQEEA